MEESNVSGMDIDRAVDDSGATASTTKHAAAGASTSEPPQKKLKSSTTSTREELDPSFLALVAAIRQHQDLKDNFRSDWKSDPRRIDERPCHLTKMSNEYVGLVDEPGKIVTQLWPDETRDRPALGMVNACSGSGKSALLQYCELMVNCSGNDVFALAVTFNKVLNDRSLLEPVEGLAMRLAERFLIMRDEKYHFNKFRNFWINGGYKQKITIESMISSIQRLLQDANSSQKLIILVDEPGLAGSVSREYINENGKVEYDDKYKPLLVRELVEVSSAYRAEEREVRFVFSSLKPVYEGGELKEETKTRGPVCWFDIPSVSPTKAMRNALTKRLGNLRRRMYDAEHRLASDLIITMASGHWTTFDSIVGRLVALEQKVGGVLGTLYYENLRDGIVQSEEVSSKYRSVQIPETYRVLIMLTVFGVSIDPFLDNFSFECNKDEAEHLKEHEIVTLNDMAYERIVQNKIRSTKGNAKFDRAVPHLSLIQVRDWCLHTTRDYDRFKEAIRDVFYSVGHDPTRKHSEEEENYPLGIAYERTSTAFVLAKFLSWQFLHSKSIFFTKPRIKLTKFLSGYDILWENPNDMINRLKDDMIKVPEKKPVRLYIKGQGGFRSNQNQLHPGQFANESDDEFTGRKAEFYNSALKTLTFESCEVPKLYNGCIVCPGSKISLTRMLSMSFTGLMRMEAISVRDLSSINSSTHKVIPRQKLDRKMLFPG